ncbi:hypothetical protein EBR21_16530, partial [bacterium]|nr:hypothetical protein [bacterium]
QVAFVIVATDGTLANSQNVTVNVNVNAVNSAPVIAGPYTDSATMNTWKEVTYANLITYLGATDVEPGNLTLRVDSIVAGQALKIGTSGDAGNPPAVADYSGSNNTVTTGKSIYWKPATNYTGTTDAVKFTAIDSGNLSSATQGLLRMAVTGSNAAPTISGTNFSMGSGYAVGKPFTISYSTLAAANALNAADADGAFVTLVLTSISNGTIKKGSTNMVAMVGASQANPVTPSADAQLVPGESLVFFPTSTTTGSAVTLATVRAWDGITYSSTEVTLQATFVAAGNQIPVLTYVKDFNGALKDTAFSFTYDTLRGEPALMSQGTQRTDAYDAEEVIANKTLKFRVESVNEGVLARTAGGTIENLSAGKYIGSGESFTWTPAAGVTGMRTAFTIVAWDGTNASATPVQVRVYINKDPVFTNSTNIISGIMEN